MDGQQFDRFTRTLATGTTRRRALALLGAGLGAVVAGIGQRQPAAAINCPDGGVCPAGTTCCEVGGCGFRFNDRDCGCDHIDCGACGSCNDGTCVPTYAGFTCRASEGPCDRTEHCDGVSMECPADRVSQAGVVCRQGTLPCEGSAVCNGVDKTCPPTNPPKPADGFFCRQPIDFCDAGAFCDGINPTCPPSQPRPAGGTCRVAEQPCDAPEFCDGVSRFCPPNQFQPATFQCRDAVDPCDEPAFCTGSSSTCPANPFKPAGTVCRDADGPCDLDDICNGSASFCASRRQPAGTVCREATGPCDIAEVCNGFSAACPADAFQPTGTSCDDGNVCNGIETCDSAGQCLAGEPLDCDDGDPCTIDSCDPVLGCVHVDIANCCRDDPECDDGDACTVDRCVANVCASTSVVCPSDNPCAESACLDGACQTIPIANNTACGANGACWDGVCVECDHKREVFCDGQCRRSSAFNQDDRNCGACGHVCPIGYICKGGFCVAPTSGGGKKQS